MCSGKEEFQLCSRSCIGCSLAQYQEFWWHICCGENGHQTWSTNLTHLHHYPKFSNTETEAHHFILILCVVNPCVKFVEQVCSKFKRPTNVTQLSRPDFLALYPILWMFLGVQTDCTLPKNLGSSVTNDIKISHPLKIVPCFGILLSSAYQIKA